MVVDWRGQGDDSDCKEGKVRRGVYIANNEEKERGEEAGRAPAIGRQGQEGGRERDGFRAGSGGEERGYRVRVRVRGSKKAGGREPA